MMTKPWEPNRDIIVDLYINQKLTLKIVKGIMEENYGFSASIRAYLHHLQQWGAEKYNRRRNQTAARSNGGGGGPTRRNRAPARRNRSPARRNRGDRDASDDDDDDGGVSGAAAPEPPGCPVYDFSSPAENAATCDTGEKGFDPGLFRSGSLPQHNAGPYGGAMSLSSDMNASFPPNPNASFLVNTLSSAPIQSPNPLHVSGHQSNLNFSSYSQAYHHPGPQPPPYSEACHHPGPTHSPYSQALYSHYAPPGLDLLGTMNPAAPPTLSHVPSQYPSLPFLPHSPILFPHPHHPGFGPSFDTDSATPRMFRPGTASVNFYPWGDYNAPPGSPPMSERAPRTVIAVDDYHLSDINHRGNNPSTSDVNDPAAFWDNGSSKYTLTVYPRLA